MKKLYTLSIVLLSYLSFGQTPISIISAGITYTETFDGMGANGTTYIPGWTAINTIGGVPLTTMTANNGSTTTGNIYNVGTTGSTERAFGTVADGTTIPALGAVFQNNTGSTATRVVIRTRMEQWSQSGNAINEKVIFSYSIGATGLNDGSATWTAVTALDLKEQTTTSPATIGSIDGNLSANYNNTSQSIINLNWADGANLWIKWEDTNDSGANGMYAIDDFQILVTQVLGVKQNAIAGLNMYPNPVSQGTLYITSNSGETKTVSIYDLLGKQVLNTTTSDNAVNVSSLTSGSYIVKITEEGKTDTKKLIIQ